jgi:hypothetical protein
MVSVESRLYPMIPLPDVSVAGNIYEDEDERVNKINTALQDLEQSPFNCNAIKIYFDT